MLSIKLVIEFTYAPICWHYSSKISPSSQCRCFKNNNKCVANSYPCSIARFRKTHFKSKYKGSQCFLVLALGVFMTEFSCLVSISDNHLNHRGTTGQKRSKSYSKRFTLRHLCFQWSCICGKCRTNCSALGHAGTSWRVCSKRCQRASCFERKNIVLKPGLDLFLSLFFFLQFSTKWLM